MLDILDFNDLIKGKAGLKCISSGPCIHTEYRSLGVSGISWGAQ